MRSIRVRSALIALALVAGCRSQGSSAMRPDGGSGGPDGGGDSGQDDSIFDIQGGKIPMGTSVRLVGVVVTAVDAYGKRVGGIYVEEPAGGELSGVFVYNPTVAGGATLAPGDVVTVEGGLVDEFALSTDTSGRTLTEISPPMGGTIKVTKTASGQVPAAAVVDPVVLAESPDEAEKWEGVLVRFEHVAVANDPRGVSSSDPLLMEATVTGPFAVSASLTALDTLKKDDCVSVTGLVDYFFDYKIDPRAADDMVVGAAADCVYEADEASCQNGEDDDHDGFADCMDYGCQSVVADCTGEATVAEVQEGTITKGSRVKLAGVVITALAEKTIWVEDAAGGVMSGVAVYFKDGAPGGHAIGDAVTVEGMVTEYMTPGDTATVTEIENPSLSDAVAGTAPAALVVDDPSSLTAAASAEVYEGVLVTVANVKVVALPDAHGEWTVGDATTPLHIDDMMVKPADLSGGPPVVGECLASITGPLHYAFGFYKIEPRAATDVVRAGAGCP